MTTLNRALELIQDRLPPHVLLSVNAAMPIPADSDEVNVKHFSLSRIADPETMRDISLTRLRGAVKYSNPIVEELQKKIRFLDESLQAVSKPEIWHAYYVEGTRVINFFIDLRRSEVLETEYVQRPDSR